MTGEDKNWAKNVTRTRQFHPSWIVIAVVVTVIVALVIWASAEMVKEVDQPDHSGANRTESVAEKIPATGESSQGVNVPGAPGSADNATVPVKFSPPDPDSIPQNEMGDMIRLGYNIFTDTQTYARQYVGNGLNCVNCHVDAGRKAESAPLWASFAMFPAYRDKNKKVNSYEDRLAGCFRFSMNGKAPAVDSKEMLALVSYSAWLAKGAPVGLELEGRGYRQLPKPAQPADLARGKQVFEDNCVICHGADGQGTKVGGKYVFPPLWGPDSYNGGAGMTKAHNAAGFIQANMPLGKGDTLTDQEAWDVAEYMNSHSRPPDPRKGGK